MLDNVHSCRVKSLWIDVVTFEGEHDGERSVWVGEEGRHWGPLVITQEGKDMGGGGGENTQWVYSIVIVEIIDSKSNNDTSCYEIILIRKDFRQW